MTFDMLGKRLVAAAKKAVHAFAKEHGDVVVTAFAFDADPYNEFFACCFDDGTTRSVGHFRHHLFYELELPVHAQLPKGGAPATKGKDGYIEKQMRPVLVAACKAIAEGGILATLSGAPKVRIGYSYPSEKMTVVATVAGAKRATRSAKPKAAAPEPMEDEEIHALLKQSDAFDRLAYVFEPKRMRHRTLWGDAFTTLLLLCETPKRIDDRWIDRAISLLEVPSVRNSAIYVLGSSKQPRALDALVVSAKQEDGGRAATELANCGDPRAGSFLRALLADKAYRREVGWILGGLGKCGDQTSIPVIEAWIASRRNPDDPAVDAAKRALAMLAKAKKRKPKPSRD